MRIMAEAGNHFRGSKDRKIYFSEATCVTAKIEMVIMNKLRRPESLDRLRQRVASLTKGDSEA